MAFPALQSGAQPPTGVPAGTSLTKGGRRYELKVTQQPKRARMCGFGDKDRRPITPPPCVRLIITDIATGKEVDCNEIDHSMFVLNVDLWSEDGNTEKNLVKHSAGTAGHPGSNISAISYEDAHQAMVWPSPYPAPPYPQQHSPTYPSHPSHPSYPPPHNGSNYPPPAPAPYSPAALPYVTSGAAIHGLNTPVRTPGGSGPPEPYRMHKYEGTRYDDGPHYSAPSPAIPAGMYTRNLIGSLSASAFRLTDQNDFIGIWFVLQDLSVRTEGDFRLRFSFVNVGAAGTSSTGINTGRALVLASCFSEPFTVFSAKKFPGVVESTQLSKCFATQGIKIPIRKEGTNKDKADRSGEYDED
ncbi:velvet factor [Calycina marina]|uniref:Velvet factor n=1 Tax=Calycina marina TaxID=1763456 RepID=A0A9P7Z5Z7_9HELO|nr:velvet factor [Calycina marina]